jgi:hypothetical protein
MQDHVCRAPQLRGRRHRCIGVVGTFCAMIMIGLLSSRYPVAFGGVWHLCSLEYDATVPEIMLKPFSGDLSVGIAL